MSILSHIKRNLETGIGLRFSDETVLSELVNPFEKHIIKELGFEGRYDNLYELERISMLLKLMEWPGLDANLIKDMGFDDRQRKVLPGIETLRIGKCYSCSTKCSLPQALYIKMRYKPYLLPTAESNSQALHHSPAAASL